MGKMSINKEQQYKKKGASPGKSIVLKTSSSGSQERETEHYQLHGIASGVTPDSRAVEVSVGTAGRIIVATQNYNLEVEVTAGQTKIYSTSADGKTLKSLIDLDVNGNVNINGDADFAVAFNDLKSEFNKLNDEYNKLVTRMLGWTPVANDGGAALKAAIVVPPSVAVSGSNIDLAKVDTVRFP